MVQVPRTTNPLPFGDLEPRRFEDLVRQLLYDFRQWRKLEGTGRTGSDGSYDARGYEIVTTIGNEDAGDDGSDAAEPTNDRLWLVQCKREKSIPPKRLLKYLEEIPIEERTKLYGIVFAAACDFSKAARDQLNEWARQHGISETHMWGKGELEDQLYQPKNDNLLFAYFGISLQIRKRTVKTALRARLAIKKRLETVLNGAWEGRCVLLRDPTDDRYPWAPDGEEEKLNPRRWRVIVFKGHDPIGIKYELLHHFAFVDDQRKSWDMVDSFNDVDATTAMDDSWSEWSEHQMDREVRGRIWSYWHALPEQNRATYIKEVTIPYDQILAVDDQGDSAAEFPHIYRISPGLVAFQESITVGAMHSRIVLHPENLTRIKHFPEVFPEVPPLEAPR